VGLSEPRYVVATILARSDESEGSWEDVQRWSRANGAVLERPAFERLLGMASGEA
jgi:hypothetical protein